MREIRIVVPVKSLGASLGKTTEIYRSRSLTSFIEIGQIKRVEGTDQFEINMTAFTSSDGIVVDRKAFLELLDIFDLFPQAEKVEETPPQIRADMVAEIKRSAHAIRDYVTTDDESGIALSHALTQALFILDACDNIEKFTTKK